MGILNDIDLILVLDVSWLAKYDWVDVKQLVSTCVLQSFIFQPDDGEVQLCVHKSEYQHEPKVNYVILLNSVGILGTYVISKYIYIYIRIPG